MLVIVKKTSSSAPSVILVLALKTAATGYQQLFARVCAFMLKAVSVIFKHVCLSVAAGHLR